MLSGRRSLSHLGMSLSSPSWAGGPQRAFCGWKVGWGSLWARAARNMSLRQIPGVGRGLSLGTQLLRTLWGAMLPGELSPRPDQPGSGELCYLHQHACNWKPLSQPAWGSPVRRGAGVKTQATAARLQTAQGQPPPCWPVPPARPPWPRPQDLCPTHSSAPCIRPWHTAGAAGAGL